MTKKKRLIKKIYMVGESKVGKSALLKKLKSSQFSTEPELDFTLYITGREEYEIRNEIWDISGYGPLDKSVNNLKKDDVIIFVADINKPESIEALKNWNGAINRIAKSQRLKKIVVFTKVDEYKSNDPQKIKNLIEETAEKIETKRIYYTSAKTGNRYNPNNEGFSEIKNGGGIKTIFDDLANLFIEDYKKQNPSKTTEINYFDQLKTNIEKFRKAAQWKKNQNYYENIANSLDNVIKQIEQETVDGKMSKANQDVCKFLTEETNKLVKFAEQDKAPPSPKKYAQKFANKLDEKLYGKQPSHGVRTGVCIVIGALMGFAIGFAVGAALTAWGGGFGAFPVAIAFAGAGGAIAGGASGGGSSYFFHKHKENAKTGADKPTEEVQSAVNNVSAALKA